MTNRTLPSAPSLPDEPDEAQPLGAEKVAEQRSGEAAELRSGLFGPLLQANKQAPPRALNS